MTATVTQQTCEGQWMVLRRRGQGRSLTRLERREGLLRPHILCKVKEPGYPALV